MIEMEFKEGNLRIKRIDQLKDTLARCNKFIKANNYADPNVMLADATLYLELEREIQIQSAYLAQERLNYRDMQ